MDLMVLRTQMWLNDTYGNDSRYNLIPLEDENICGKSTWTTIYALRRALQIEEGLQETSDSFGDQTYNNCPNVYQGEENNIVYIIQGALWCKGYNPTGFTGYYGEGTYNAVKALKSDMGFTTATGNMNRDVMRALLDMSAFTLVLRGDELIRSVQQKLNYDYYDYYRICPCDGLYGREMNKMLIYALQKEEGLAKNQATGTFGEWTMNNCPSYVYGNSSNIIKLIRYALICNGYNISIDSSQYNDELENVLEEFAWDLRLTRTGNTLPKGLIKSLLTSNGDTSRYAYVCDTATRLNQNTINTLNENNYRIVGRYLTKVSGGLDKNMTIDELTLVFDNNLSVFPIFQEYGGGASAFTDEAGTSDAIKAYNAARQLGIPVYKTIYFAVDYDPQETEIYSNIVPYFKAVYAYFKSKRSYESYQVGVYGTRNVCRILKLSEGQDLRIANLFVSDASYGFSGNMGFKMPKDWTFDQFATDITIGSGNGIISIDKVAHAFGDNGFNTLGTDISDIEKVYYNILDVYNMAYDYSNEDMEKSNLLVLQYFRCLAGNYGSCGGEFSLSNQMWDVVAGEIDVAFCQIVSERFSGSDFIFNDQVTGVEYDIKHWAATLNALLHLVNESEWTTFEGVIDAFAGWAGDLTTFANAILNMHGDEDIVIWAKENICSETKETSFNRDDYIADVDAVVCYHLLQEEMESIADLFYHYLIKGKWNTETMCYKRTTNFINYQYGGLIGNFETYCDAINIDDFPIDVFRWALNHQSIIEQKYYDAATEALKYYVMREVFNGR